MVSLELVSRIIKHVCWLTESILIFIPKICSNDIYSSLLLYTKLRITTYIVKQSAFNVQRVVSFGLDFSKHASPPCVLIHKM